jgi:hypothetical protein
MTTKEFRENPDYVNSLRRVLELDIVKLWLECLDNESPAKVSARNDVTPHGAHILLGGITGWQLYRDEFRLGAKHLELSKNDDPRTPANQTYGAEPTESESTNA